MKTLLPLGMLAALALAGGCMTPTDPEYVSRMQDIDVMHERVQKLQDRIQAVELEQQDLHREMTALKQSLGSASQPTQARLETLEKRVVALDAAREQDRKAIIDELSHKVSALMSSAASGGSSSSGRSRRGAGGGGGSDTGYEHVVQSGDTLSAIAKAYGVSQSAILSANNMKSSSMLRVGQNLFIPKP